MDDAVAVARLDLVGVGIFGQAQHAAELAVHTLARIDVDLGALLARLGLTPTGDRQQPLVDRYIERRRVDARCKRIDLDRVGRQPDVDGREGPALHGTDARDLSWGPQQP